MCTATFCQLDLSAWHWHLIVAYIMVTHCVFTQIQKTEPTLPFTWHFSHLIPEKVIFFIANCSERKLYIYIVCVSVAGHEHVPSWVWVAAGLFNFLAYTLGESRPLQVLCVVFCPASTRLEEHFSAMECILHSDFQTWALVKITCLLLKHTLCFDISDFFLAFLLYK